jgi:uncharacterized protein YydD (DUF2326 family)
MTQLDRDELAEVRRLLQAEKAKREELEKEREELVEVLLRHGLPAQVLQELRPALAVDAFVAGLRSAAK